ncbi:MAG: hypothetical protein IPO78_05275 [Saprospiraceae bacterium]|nr:hypothetical protein [Saprospiraceae bacterium]
MKNIIKKSISIFAMSAFIFLIACNNNKSKEITSENESATTKEQDHVHIYACPMHPEVTGQEGEKCSKCGMALEHMDEKPMAGNFQMDFKSAPEILEAGKPAVLAFTPRNKNNSAQAVPLDVTHEKKIHLIAVREDLSWFNHIHPEYQEDGSYTISETFPSGGKYLLYADYKPSESTHQLEKIEVDVKGKSASRKTYTAIQNTAFSNPFSVTLKPDDGKFISNTAIHFDAVFLKNGKSFDVNQLQNYLGAKGHMVAIHMETKAYVHLHPEVEGTILHFHTNFETAGIYRVWLQFMADGKLHTTDFVIKVEPSTSKVMNEENQEHNHEHGEEGHKH